MSETPVVLTKNLMFFTLLVSLCLPAAADSKADQEFMSCCREIRQLGRACNEWASTHGGAFPASLEVLTPKYLRKIGNCPLGKPYIYKKDKSQGYILECSSPHGKVRPAFNAKDGYPSAVLKKAEAISASSRTNASACKSNLRNIATAAEMYASDHNGRYPETMDALSPNYLYPKLKCPATGSDTYSVAYRSTSSPAYYRVNCQGHHHKDEGYKPNFPAYDSVKGSLEK